MLVELYVVGEMITLVEFPPTRLVTGLLQSPVGAGDQKVFVVLLPDRLLRLLHTGY